MAGKTTAERQRANISNKREHGLVSMQVWISAEDRARLNAAAKRQRLTLAGLISKLARRL